MKYIVTVILIIFSISAFAQNPANDAIVVFTGNGSIRTMDFKSKPKSIKGSYYYNDEWNNGTIKLFSGETIENYPLKYDLKMNQVDIKVNSSIKVLAIGTIKEIVWINKKGFTEILRNTSQYKNNNIGFFSVLTEGEISFFKKTDLKVLESTYNPAMDVGSQSKKYLKQETYYTLINKELTRVKKNKKKILAKFEDKAEMVKKYADENSLNFKNDYDLSKIFNYYNNL